MRCEDIKKKILWVLESDLSEDEKKKILNHLNDCEKCRLEFEFTKGILESARSIKIPQYDEAFWSSRYEEILEKARERNRRLIFTRRLSLIPGFAIVLFVAIFAWKVYFFKNEPVEPVSLQEQQYNIPEEVLSDHELPLPVEELRKIVGYLDHEDHIMILASYLH